MSQKLIGILGGTFDPIHLGHLHLAAKTKELCNLDEILLVPCFQSPLRESPQASAKDRLNMLKLAITNLPYLAADDRELNQHKPSYMIETLRALHLAYSNSSLCLIMGIDAFCKFNEWQQWQAILEVAHLIIADRPDAPRLQNRDVLTLVEKRQIINAALLQNSIAGSIYFVNIDPLPISATKIRALIKNKQDASQLVTPSVWEYICNNQLYNS